MQDDAGKSKQEVGDVRPTSIKHLIGQQSVKAQVSVALDAAFADNRRFDHALSVGPPGVGKSALAEIIAAEMASQYHEVLGQRLKKPGDLNALLLSAQDKDVIHVDEAHELDKRQQTALYLALDKRTLFAEAGGGRKPEPLPLADFTLILSTTDEYRLLQPLRDRMRLVLRFDYYDDSELTELVRQRAQALRWVVDEAVLPLIAGRARGTPRIALTLLQSAYRVARSRGETAVTPTHLNRACELGNLNESGLNGTEQQYLRLLAHGPLRLNVLASKLGLPARTVADVVEAFLLRAALIDKTADGRRELAASGREMIAKSGQNSP